MNNMFQYFQVVFDGTLKGNIRPRFSLDGRQIVRATLPVRNVRHQIQLKNRVVSTIRPEPSTSVTNIQTNIPVMKNVIPKQVKNVIPKVDRQGQINNVIKGQKIAISGGQLSANVQAIAFTTAQLKARQGRLIAQPRATAVS